ncbi:MAG: hypothetical protein PGN21_07055 [Sphingomonas paucimobilis]
MTDIGDEFRRDALIACRSVTLADIAEQLLAEDAGAALIKASLLCWERKYGRASALTLAETALIAVQHEAADGAVLISN